MWQGKEAAISHEADSWSADLLQNPIIMFLCGVMVTLVVLGLVWAAKSGKCGWGSIWWNRRYKAYEQLLQDTVEVHEDSKSGVSTSPTVDTG